MVSSINNFIEIDYAAAFQIYSSDKFTAEFCLSPFFKTGKNGGTISITPNNVSTKDLSIMGIHESSYLKDVYPYQIVSEAHLSYKIDGISLKDWIFQSELNGYLFEFGDNKWIWVIDDKVINQIRERLIENNLLTSYMHLSDKKIKRYGNY